ncbi:MAG TPA: hypothetical protein ENI64_12640, partial [Gammaproteobacteria bacterium]|nr:hypothetical protein [Gammaproteobacteria bacterium]
MSEFATTPPGKKLVSLLLCFSILMGFAQASIAAEFSLDESWKILSSKSYSKKARAIETIAQHNPPKAHLALKAMLDGQLYFAKRSKELYV